MAERIDPHRFRHAPLPITGITLALLVAMPPNIPTLATPTNQAVNCWQCRHLATSWDPALPYLCKLMGFKSKMLPSIQILQVDGRPCQGFDAKPAKATPKPGVSVSRQ
jgi:hypothetical protein